jgi:hypothetical protein
MTKDNLLKDIILQFGRGIQMSSSIIQSIHGLREENQSP